MHKHVRQFVGDSYALSQILGALAQATSARRCVAAPALPFWELRDFLYLIMASGREVLKQVFEVFYA